jgi:hypothetical protein
MNTNNLSGSGFMNSIHLYTPILMNTNRSQNLFIKFPKLIHNFDLYHLKFPDLEKRSFVPREKSTFMPCFKGFRENPSNR